MVKSFFFLHFQAKNSDYYSSYVTEDFTTYLNRKRMDTCHGNHLEIQAMSEIYNRPIEVYQYSLGKNSRSSLLRCWWLIYYIYMRNVKNSMAGFMFSHYLKKWSTQFYCFSVHRHCTKSSWFVCISQYMYLLFFRTDKYFPW